MCRLHDCDFPAEIQFNDDLWSPLDGDADRMQSFGYWASWLQRGSDPAYHHALAASFPRWIAKHMKSLPANIGALGSCMDGEDADFQLFMSPSLTWLPLCLRWTTSI